MIVNVNELYVQNSYLKVKDCYIVKFYKDILDKKNINETEYFYVMNKLIKSGTFLYGCKSENDINKYLNNRVSELKSDIKDNKIPVKIRQDGTIELLDGHHRVSRKIAEGFEELTVEVAEMSEMFKTLEQDLFSIYNKKFLYQEIEHPYFSNWDKNNSNRLNAIKEYIQKSIKDGRLTPDGNAIDYGCITGGISRILASLGFRTHGIDVDPKALKIAEYLDFICGKGKFVNYSKADLLKNGDWLGWSTTISITLSLLHHWLRPSRIEHLKMFLPTIAKNSKLLIIDVPSLEDTFTESSIPLSKVKQFYIDLLPEHEVETIAWFSGREVLAFWRKY